MFDLVLLAQAADASNLKVWAYAGFLLLVLLFLALDLGVFHRDAHEVSMKEAAGWSVVWVCTALLFGGFVYMAYEGHWLGLGLNTPMYNPLAANDPNAPTVIAGEVGGLEALEQYVTGYVVEKSLAMDNIFVIAMLFAFFAVPAKYQHRVLFWGILGALAMRAGMIFLGAELVARYTWVLIIFGGFLVLTAVKMALIRSESDPAKNPVVRLVSRVLPVVPFMDGQRFFTRRTLAPTHSMNEKNEMVQDPAPAGSLRTGGVFSGGWAVTPLFLALVMVEVTDLIFAVDSIPAIFAITPDPFIVFTSNIFAILGLRSLYFCLAALIAKFRLLKPALILILAFVGVKLLLLSLPPYLDDMGLVSEPMRSIKISTTVSLGVVLGVLVAAVGLSAAFPKRAGAGA
jgi:tellurite resistance protein TerC